MSERWAGSTEVHGPADAVVTRAARFGAEERIVIVMTVLALLSLSWAVVAYVSHPEVSQFWAWVPSMVTYFALAALSPRLRPLFTTVTASIWLPLVGLVVLVAVPLSILIAGPKQGVLPLMPEWQDINYSMIVSTVAYAAFAVLLISFPAIWRGGVSPAPGRASPVLVMVLLGLAYLGALIKLQAQGGATAYFGGTVILSRPGTMGVAFGLASTFFPALGPLGAMVYWRSRDRLLWRDLGVALIAVLPLTTFSYNRGSWVFPLVTLLLVFLRRRPRLGRPAVAIAVLLIPVAVIMVGTLRTQAQLRQYNLEMRSTSLDIAGMVQVYGNSPQQQAMAIAVDPGRPTLLASILHPVPYFGKPFRDAAGPAVWNNALYGSSTADQILPLSAELYWIQGLVSVVIGFGALGVVVGFLTRLTTLDSDPVRLYMRLLMALWLTLGLTWSASVMMQMIVYFWIVPYLFLRLTRHY